MVIFITPSNRYIVNLPLVYVSIITLRHHSTYRQVKQGDVLSPSLFSIYLNDLAVEVKSLNCGVDIDRCNVSILLYADDIVLLSPDEPSLQQMLDVIASWCKKWRMYRNTDKTQIVHYRAQRKLCTKYVFTLDGTQLDIVQAYRYLGVILDEHLSFLANQLHQVEHWV